MWLIDLPESDDPEMWRAFIADLQGIQPRGPEIVAAIADAEGWLEFALELEAFWAEEARKA